MSDPQPITLDQLSELGIDKAGHLFWRGQEVVTTLSLPWIVQVATIIGAVAALIAATWPIVRFFLDRRILRASAETRGGAASPS